MNAQDRQACRVRGGKQTAEKQKCDILFTICGITGENERDNFRIKQPEGQTEIGIHNLFIFT